MPDDDRLRLIALDTDDLAVVSAHVQDAVLKLEDVNWFPKEKRLVMVMNRFAWEQTETGSRRRRERQRRRRERQRRRSALHFARVDAVKSTGIDRNARDSVLSLLALRFEPRNEPSGDIVLDFAGGATMRLAVECVEAQLTDLGPAWSTPYAPQHILT
jgi:hypothetical protein